MLRKSFETELKKNISGIQKLILDFMNLEYISSAGLIVILLAQKIVNKQGEMIKEVFDVTGFSDILTIK